MSRIRAAGGRRSRMNRSVEAEVDSHGSWAISYGDMITLLLTFFILYFNLESKPGAKPDALMESMVSQLSKIDPGQSPRKSAIADEAGEGGGKKDASLRMGKDLEKGIVEFLPQEFGARVHKLGHQVVIEFPAHSFFEFGKIEVNQKGQALLKRFSELFQPFAGTHFLGIRAFTDTKPVRQIPGRKFQDNLELSALRAVATMRVLQRVGVPLARMKLGGYGELRATVEQLRKIAGIEKQLQEFDPDQNATPLRKGGATLGDDLSLSLARKVVLVIEPENAEENAPQRRGKRE